MWTPPERKRHRLPLASWPSESEAAKSKLFSPLEFQALTLEQRTWVPAMVPWRATPDGEVSPEVLAWYARFAKGRPGALVVEATGVADIPSGPLLRIGHDRFVPGLRRLAEAVRQASGGHTRLLIQLIDFLAVKRRPSPDRYFGRYLVLRESHREAAATGGVDPASEAAVRAWLAAQNEATLAQILDLREFEALQYGYRERVGDVQLAHIEALPRELPDRFASAAVRAKEAGFDGVELHYAHAYTMASFLSRTNDRRDGYGGNQEGRLRLPLEVYGAVRERVGADFAVGCRFLGDEVIEGGSRIEDAKAYAWAFARAGMDFLSISKGGKFDDAKQPKVGEAVYPYTGQSGYECMPTVRSDDAGPFGRNVPLAAEIRAALRAAGLQTPVVTAGGIASFELAEGILNREEADVIGAARQSLADPDWFEKIRQGRGAQVRRCKFTNYCEALDTRHLEVTCQLWDRTELDEPGCLKSADGRRRLVAPAWEGERSPS